jgi:hypothetical protein
MSSNQVEQYNKLKKKAWIVYSLATLTFIAVLVLFVARDNEEIFFYSIMPAAAAYVLRPSEKLLEKWIFKFTGVSAPKDEE